MIVDEWKKRVNEVLTNLGVAKPEAAFEHPAELAHGDYSTNAALVSAKELKLTPRVLAEKIVAVLRENPIKEVAKIEIAGAGFINFYLSTEFLAREVDGILKQGEDFGRQNIGKKKKVLVEFSSPNIAKPFTIGHLRSTIIGDAVAKILSFLGFAVIRDNHLGDWGTQFGKLIVAIKKWGGMNEIAKSPAPVRKLVDLYVRFHTEAKKDPELEDEARQWFVKLEQGEREARSLWEQCVTWSLKEFETLYTRLGVAFDTAYGESFYEDKITTVVRELEEKKLLRESEGARLVFFPDEVLPSLMILKKDGATLYATRDVATERWRKKEYGDDLVIANETGTEQSLYFKQLFMVEEMLGWFRRGERVHIGHGLTRGKEGKMSTREGTAIWLEEVLDEAVKRAATINPETAEAVGIGALKFNDLKREARQDIVFDWDEILNLKGDSGPYLQYSYARARSVLKKAEELEVQPQVGKEVEPREPTILERLLYRFPEVVERAGREYEPHFITTYLTELAGEFNNWYAHNRILDAGDEASYRVTLTEAFATVMKNGLTLLGIPVLEKM